MIARLAAAQLVTEEKLQRLIDSTAAAGTGTRGHKYGWPSPNDGHGLGEQATLLLFNAFQPQPAPNTCDPPV